MSREIKFRAWWQDGKYMPEGKMYMVAGFHNVVEHDYDEPERDISDKPQEVFIVPQLPTVEKVNWNEAKNMRLMQYTGLKDKNGVEIYEGDICEIKGKNYKYMFEIVWDEQTAGFNFKQITYGLSDMEFMPDYLNWNEMMIDKISNIEVIGNIYENPELLK